MARASTPIALPEPQLIIEEARRDMQDVHRSVSDAAARLQQSKQLLEAYLAKISAERPVGGELGLGE